MNKKYLINIYSFILFFAAVYISSTPSYFADNSSSYKDECIKCHVENDLMPEHYIENDIHWQKGLSCSGCHGGDPNETDEELAMSMRNGFIGVPDKNEIPKFCGKCHSYVGKMQLYQARIPTDQVAQYYISKHGQQLKIGNIDVATCTDCHTSHSILPASDTRSVVNASNLPSTCDHCHGNSELMSRYNLKTTQLEEYSKSVHGIALLENHDTGAPSCNDCHGNHGAKPPGVESISHVCGSCHVNNMNYFNNSIMSEEFSLMDIKACEQCHGYHLINKTNDEMVNVGKSSTCTECHSEGEEGYIAAEMMYNQINKLSVLYDSTNVLSEKVNIMGMNNIEIEYSLKNIKQNLIQSRTLIHTFDTSKIFEKTNEGILASENAMQLANNEMAAYFERRLGYGITTLILILLALALYWKIRSLKR